MILAAVDGDWVIPLLVVVIGFINWIAGKLKSTGKPPAAGRPAPTASTRPGADPEEERMRKFFEALGIPSESAPPPTKPLPRQPPPLRQEQRKKQRPVPSRSAPPQLPRERSLDEAPAPTLSVEQLSVPNLVVPAVPDFTTVSSTIGAIPNERLIAVTAIADAPSRSERVRLDLGSKAQLRSAFVLREVLGPPRSMQS